MVFVPGQRFEGAPRRTYAIARAWSAAWERLRGTGRESITGVPSEINLVVPFDETQYPNDSEPLYSIRSFAGPWLGQFPTCTITSERDIEVIRVEANVIQSTGGIANGQEWGLLSPPTTWVPFVNGPFDPVNPPLQTFPGVSPRRDGTIGSGGTTVIIGSNPLSAPYIGWSQRVDYINIGGAKDVAPNTAFIPKSRFILPAGAFLTAVPNDSNKLLLTNFLFRELQ